MSSEQMKRGLGPGSVRSITERWAQVEEQSAVQQGNWRIQETRLPPAIRCFPPPESLFAH